MDLSPQIAEGFEQSLQLINKDSFITSLKSEKSQKLIQVNEQLSSPRTFSSLQSDYGYSSDPGTERPSTGSINRSFCDSLGMPTVGDLFFDAQRDYVERFVLGIDPRRHEINQEVSMLKTGGRP